MSARFRIAFGFALSLILMTSITVFAKGGFSFITIAGPGLDEEVRSTDPALTTDFFAFADYYQDKTEVPAKPGTGYEITRYYIDGSREIAFDRLHYYPDTGFVYYDGIAGGGSSEYDGEWYTAKPEIKTIFESALAKPALPSASVSQPEPIQSVAQVQARKSVSQLSYVMPIASMTGLVLIFVLALRLRRRSSD